MNTVTEEYVNKIILDGKIEVTNIGNKTTLVVFTTKEGFVITESSSCVDPTNYNEEYGKEICMERIKNKIWELEGYYIQKSLHKQTEEILIGEKIKIKRKECSLTQKILAERSGVSENAIKQYETNKRTPRIDQLTKISKALGCSVLELL